MNNVLDFQTGYFTTKAESLDSQIKLMDTRIERANTQLSKYEARMTMHQMLKGRWTKMLWWSQAHREGEWKVF